MVEGPAQGLDDTTAMAETKFLRSQRKFCLRLHYNGSISFFYLLMPKKISHFKVKTSEIKPYPLFLGNIQKTLC